MDSLSFCNIHVIEQDTQYTNTASTSSFTPITYQDIPNCNTQHKNAPEDGLLKSETC